MKSALAAFKFLTFAYRVDAASTSPEQIGKGAALFPLVGLVLGLVLALLNRLLEPYLESEILGVVLITVLILITGAIHLEGTQQTFDRLPAGMHSEQSGKPLIRIYGILSLLIIVLFKVRAVEVIGETRTLSLLVTPVLARWSAVIFLYGSSSVTDESARIIAENTRGWQLLSATIVTLTFAIFMVGRAALWIGLCLSLLALLSRTYLHRRTNGITCNQLGALIELSETLSLVLFASI
jgi:adenosylcobinamide-GDP ribazoletransferase